MTIDNPELLTRLKEAEAANAVAMADLKRIEVGTREEVIAQRRAALAAAAANERLAEQSYDRTKQLTMRDFASRQKLDQDTATLDVARRNRQQAKLALDEAIAGYTAEERGVARAAVVKAEATITTLEAQVAELTVKAPPGCADIASECGGGASMYRLACRFYPSWTCRIVWVALRHGRIWPRA